MAANPYYKFSKITLNIHPLTSLLRDDTLEMVETLLEELTEITNRNLKKEKVNTQKNIGQKGNINDSVPHKIGRNEFLLCMKLVGILHKTYKIDFWSDLKDKD